MHCRTISTGDNSENDSFDSRSDDKGPEPEGVPLRRIQGRMYAFIGLERFGGIMMYDVTDPYHVVMVNKNRTPV